jgi:serine phosphatase RsbU (regulator of sigma subunit)
MNNGNPSNIWNRTMQKISRKLQNKLLLSFAGIGIFAVLLVGIYSFYLAKEALLFRTFEQLTAAREAKKENIEEFINNKLDGVELSTSSIALDRIMISLKKSLELEVNDKAVNIFLKGGDYHSIIVIFDTVHYAYGYFTDRVRFTNHASPKMQNYVAKIYNAVRQTKHSVVVDYMNCGDTLLLAMATPAFYQDGTFRAVVALTIRLEFIDKIMLTHKTIAGLGSTGETYLVGEDRYMRSTSIFLPRSVLRVQVHSKAAEQALAGQANMMIAPDYRNISVLSSFSPVKVPGLNWGIIAEIDEREILAPVHALRDKVLVVSGIVLIIFITMVMWISRQLSKPLVKLRSLATSIGDGAYGNTISVTTNDEVGQLTEAFNSMSLHIDDQRKQLEKRNLEILDSITYAKRIQTGLLPSQRLIESLLSDSFILYVPKHIVSGDFYYLGSEHGQIIIAVGDCTGHGVPGAFVSGICLGALQRTIKGVGKTKPSEILDRLNEIVIEMFSSSEMDIRDGMDISICSIDLQARTLQFSGANNSLFYIRHGNIHEVKADRQSICKNSEVKPFCNNEMEIQEGDCIYMLSDGFIDQFGGPKRKKFMLSRLKKLLVDIHHKPMTIQKLLLEEALNNWKDGTEQVDDICVFGARL